MSFIKVSKWAYCLWSFSNVIVGDAGLLIFEEDAHDSFLRDEISLALKLLHKISLDAVHSAGWFGSQMTIHKKEEFIL